MNGCRGGKLSRLSGYRLLVALLVCANILALGLLIREFAPAISPLPQSSGANTQSATGTCKKIAPPRLNSVKINAKHPGITKETSQLFYDVYGQAPGQIGNQIAMCSMAGEFAAETSYIINWQVSYRTQASGQCAVDTVAVGLRLRHIYPRWNNDSNAPATTVASWHAFMQHLATHESGHAALDQQYAAQILHTLQNLPASNCQTIGKTADTAANRLINSLDQANLNYDNTTSHGRTQGAILHS
ncbi:MAG TPA: DUF922 domain-containing protein [Nevskiaceae bacterium]|nr:DUF922 domain-containing protein [Nevskiaceae bacterium]